MTGMHDEKQWLSVIGIGEEGLNELSAPARKLISSAEFIIGGHRQLAMIPNSTQEKIPWPSPISSLVEKLEKFRGRQTCVLATGDPLSFGIGSTLSRIFSMAEMQIIPSLSASTLICARKGWPHNDADFISLHGRPISTLETFLRPKGKLIILSNDGQTPSIVAEFLTTRGYGASDITVFEHMNGTKERCFAGEASSWKHEPGVAFNTIAVDLQCTDIKALKTRAPGLPDNAFIHDGQITKREVRAATLSILEPFPGALLWDIGAGSGSIGIEWMRTDHRCQAIAIEENPQRAMNIATNVTQLGVPNLRIINGKAPSVLSKLPPPDAIFIGGGITTKGMLTKCWASLKTGGCLVANVMTIEGEAIVSKHQKKLGGDLTRISISNLYNIGAKQAWRPSIPITQWKVQKPIPSARRHR
tara:strand:- start:2405 stop:3652 length:1248 start_codon:yes stop_codon:yes gene_type:complete